MAAKAPIYVPFNTTATVGPDGPWNFVTLSVGKEPASNVSFLFSVDLAFSVVVDKHNCNSDPSLCYKSMGYYDAASVGAATNPYNLPNSTEDASVFMDADGWNQWKGPGRYWMDRFNDPFNFENITVYVTKNLTAGVGKKQYKPISYLALEHNDWGNRIDRTAGDPPTAWTLPWATYNASLPDGSPPSFGLHIGAANLGQAGSLYIGGYDQSRVNGPSIQHLTNPSTSLAISNISFGTTSGRYPWANRSDLPPNFATFAPQGAPYVNVSVQPAVSYISLPDSWVRRLAKFLPVMPEPDPDTGYYLWDTSKPLYHDIMSSPSYMEISFVDDSPSNQPVSIRMPFATLNLTLEPPLASVPTPYLPILSRNNVILGRAFLQSAYFGMVTLGPSRYYYLAQAPGPRINASTAPVPVPWDSIDPTLTSSSSMPKWEDTWAGVPKPLDAQSGGSGTGTGTGTGTGEQTPNASQSHDGGGPSLPQGDIAAIVVPVVVGFAAACCAGWLVWRRRRQRQRGALPAPASSSLRSRSAEPTAFTSRYVRGLNGRGARSEANSDTRYDMHEHATWH